MAPPTPAPVAPGASEGASGAAPAWKLPHLPALDGLRGLAVAGVLLYHFGYLDGGYLGVDLFFVLSGFLITSLLLGEHASRGTIGLGGFWGRRARRLLPALVGLLVGVAFFCEIWARRIDLGQIRGDSYAALLYVANWRTILHGASYWDISLAPSPLQHVWSLAIEEQFYLVWPLVVLAVLRGKDPERGRRALSRLVVAGAVLSLGLFVGLRAWGASDTRLYEGTDTRAFALFAGAFVACWYRRAADETPEGRASYRRGRATAAAVAPAAILVLGGLWIWLEGTSPVLYRGGLTLASVLAAVVVAAVASTPVREDAASPANAAMVGVLSVLPLRALGWISYGLYLWHWPVYLVLNENRTGWDGLALLALRIVVSLGLAWISYVAIEQPIRRGAMKAPIATIAAPAALIASALLITFTTTGAIDAGDVNVEQNLRPTHVIAGAPRVLYVGDSVAESLVAYPAKDPDSYGVTAYDGARIGCNNIYEGNEVKGNAGDVSRPPSCTTRWPGLLKTVKPHVVIMLWGAGPTALVKIDGAWRDACSPQYRDLLVQRTNEEVETLRADGAEVVLATGAHSTNGFRVPQADRMTDCRNETVREIAQAGPAFLVDLDAHVCPDGKCREEENGAPVRPDSTHFNGPGGEPTARWLLEQALVEAGFKGN